MTGPKKTGTVPGFLAALLLGVSLLASGQSSEVANPDPAVEKRLKGLAEELRCLVCQNQTIADSNAPLAVDLRREIRTQISQGRTDRDIRDYMVERYGAFVLYRPPLNAQTAILWGAPAVLLIGGAVVLVLTVRRRKVVPVETGKKTAGTKAGRKIQALLEED